MEGQTEQELDRSSEHFLPTNLPKPLDDKACNHLWAMDLPSLPLVSTEGTRVDLSKLPGLTVVFCYPRMGKPKEPVAEDWTSIPGARGCTPQACSISVATPDLRSVGINNIFSLSTQDPEHQMATRQHLRLRHHLLSDDDFAFCDALRLPVLEWRNMRFIKRVTLLLDHGKIVWVDYPIFPAIKSAEAVMNFMKKQSINQPNHGRSGDAKTSSMSSAPAPQTIPKCGTTSADTTRPSPSVVQNPESSTGLASHSFDSEKHGASPKPDLIPSDTSRSLPLLPKSSGMIIEPAPERSDQSPNPERSYHSPNAGTTTVEPDVPVPKPSTASSESARSSCLPPKIAVIKETGRSSPSLFKNTGAFINPVSNITGLKLQGPVTMYHPCPDWTAKKPEEAALSAAEAKNDADAKVTGEGTGNFTPMAISSITGEVSGDVSQNQDGSYSFNISGRCSTN